RLDLGEERHHGTATVLSLAFVLSVFIGTLFPYQAFGGIGVVFIQPTLWILGLFALRPIDHWFVRNATNWRPIAVWSMLALTWVQVILAFNFSHKASFDQATMEVLRTIRSDSAPDDVVAYQPSGLIQKAVLGRATESTNFAITAMTGLDGYVSSESYSIPFAVPDLSGRNSADVLAQAKLLYQQRSQDVGSFVNGDISDAARARLAKDHVRWIVVWGDAMNSISTQITPWRKTREIAAYQLPQPQ
ncbi:MAG TPA: hypothetical protein VFQ43_14750, partial [Nitrososphaera sp.]|nr:hypothetical protein [Nitrososphaera sp.]